MARLREVLDTIKLNFRMAHWPKTVLDPFEEAHRLSDAVLKQKAAIATDRRLTPQGKDEKTEEAKAIGAEALTKWHTPRLAGLDADIAVHREALLTPSTEKVDPRRIDFLLGRLQAFTPEEVGTLYGAASDEVRLALEAASSSVGPVPVKSANGVEWKPLLDPASVNEAVIGRAMKSNPAGVQKLRELEELRDTQVTVFGIALADIREG